ncbi:hypothetical protein ABW21_db0209299 [Orbilia brochopaga]|nr:hypothetical protein ABW21_db0209299 [Drechslerella brochopaga]
MEAKGKQSAVKAGKSTQSTSAPVEKPIEVQKDKFIFIVGGSGSGKSTLCCAIAEIEPNVIHINFPGQGKNGLATTMKAKKMINEIRSSRSGKHVFLVDGYPRIVKQAYEMNAWMNNKREDMCLIQFIADLEDMLQRACKVNRETQEQAFMRVVQCDRDAHGVLQIAGSLDELIPKFRTLIREAVGNSATPWRQDVIDAARAELTYAAEYGDDDAFE